MKFEGLKQQATCKDDGRWSIPTPRCLAPCIIPQIVNGRAEGRVGTSLGHGEVLRINCSANYEVQHEGEPVVCDNGDWSQRPECFPARCKVMPTPPRNGMVVVPATTHLSMALYQCKAEFHSIQ